MAVARRRGGRGQYPKRPESLPNSDRKVKEPPEYLDKPEVDALMAAAPNPRARLLMLLQWRAGLRVSEAIAIERRDLSLGVDRPTRAGQARQGLPGARGARSPRTGNRPGHVRRYAAQGPRWAAGGRIAPVGMAVGQTGGGGLPAGRPARPRP